MKNWKKSILVLGLFAFTKMFGQTAPNVQFKTINEETPIEEVSCEYLMGHRVYLRESPSLKSKKMDVLDIGTRLTLKEKSENATVINGVKSNWYCVSVGQTEGWVWGGMIAQKTIGSEANYDIKFVYGLESITVNKEGVLEAKHQIRAYKDGRQIDKIVFDGHTSSPLEFRNIGNKGLFNVEDILAFQIPDAEKGSAKGEMYIFWNNGKFTNVASLIDDYTASYDKTESFVFPSDMEGIKSTIVLETIITDKARSTENKKLLFSFYKWDGYKLYKKEALPPAIEDLVSN